MNRYQPSGCKRPQVSASSSRMVVALTLVVIAFASGSSLPAQQAPYPVSARKLLPQGTFYPRLVRLSHGQIPTNGRIIASTNQVIFESLDEGSTLTYISTVPVRDGSKERCCATLYELPRTVGALAAGTLISAATYSSESVPAIELYSSADGGRSWTYNATPVKQGSEKHGLWEPEFTVANDGALVMFWSDETDPCCSQKLVQMRTYDGVHWKDRKDTVRSTVQPGRPGMAVVSKLPSGKFFMTYEVCGPPACGVFSRTSLDGWNFGLPTDPGTKVETASGQYFEHSPTNLWTASNASPNGLLVVAGQVLYEPDGTVSPANGTLLFTNTSSDGSGPWSTVAAPVAVPGAYDNFCPNYSSALLAPVNGSKLLELASDYDSSHACVTYIGTGKLP